MNDVDLKIEALLRVLAIVAGNPKAFKPLDLLRKMNGSYDISSTSVNAYLENLEKLHSLYRSETAVAQRMQRPR